MDTCTYMRHRVSVFKARFFAQKPRSGGTNRGRWGEGEGGSWEEGKQEPRKMSEKNSNMPRNSGGRAWNASEPLDCASLAYFSRTSDIAPASFLAL